MLDILPVVGFESEVSADGQITSNNIEKSESIAIKFSGSDLRINENDLSSLLGTDDFAVFLVHVFSVVHDGFSELQSYLENQQDLILPLDLLVSAWIQPIASLHDKLRATGGIKQEWFDRYSPRFRKFILQRARNINLDEVRQLPRDKSLMPKRIIGMLMPIVSIEAIQAYREEITLCLLVRSLEIAPLERKLRVLDDLRVVVDSAIGCRHDDSDNICTNVGLAKWIRQNNVLDAILENNPHAALLRRSAFLLSYLESVGPETGERSDSQHHDSLWRALWPSTERNRPRELRLAAFDSLIQFALVLAPDKRRDTLMGLLDKVAHISAGEIDPPLITFLFDIGLALCRADWRPGSSRVPTISRESSHTSVDLSLSLDMRDACIGALLNLLWHYQDGDNMLSDDLRLLAKSGCRQLLAEPGMNKLREAYLDKVCSRIASNDQDVTARLPALTELRDILDACATPCVREDSTPLPILTTKPFPPSSPSPEPSAAARAPTPPNPRPSDQERACRDHIILRLEQQHKLTTILIKTFLVAQVNKCTNDVKGLHEVLDFLMFVMKESRLQINFEQLKAFIWDPIMSAADSHDKKGDYEYGSYVREELYTWICVLAGFAFASKVHRDALWSVCTNDTLLRLFRECLLIEVCFPIQKITLTGVSMFIACFKASHLRAFDPTMSENILDIPETPRFERYASGNGAISYYSQMVLPAGSPNITMGCELAAVALGKRFRVLKFIALTGLERLWEFSLRADKELVRSAAANFLVSLHVYAVPEAKREIPLTKMIAKCTHIVQTILALESDQPVTEKTYLPVQRALAVLWKAFQLSGWCARYTCHYATWPFAWPLPDVKVRGGTRMTMNSDENDQQLLYFTLQFSFPEPEIEKPGLVNSIFRVTPTAISAHQKPQQPKTISLHKYDTVGSIRTRAADLFNIPFEKCELRTMYRKTIIDRDLDLLTVDEVSLSRSLQVSSVILPDSVRGYSKPTPAIDGRSHAAWRSPRVSPALADALLDLLALKGSCADELAAPSWALLRDLPVPTRTIDLLWSAVIPENDVRRSIALDEGTFSRESSGSQHSNRPDRLADRRLDVLVASRQSADFTYQPMDIAFVEFWRTHLAPAAGTGPHRMLYAVRALGTLARGTVPDSVKPAAIPKGPNALASLGAAVSGDNAAAPPLLVSDINSTTWVVNFRSLGGLGLLLEALCAVDPAWLSSSSDRGNQAYWATAFGSLFEVLELLLRVPVTSIRPEEIDGLSAIVPILLRTLDKVADAPGSLPSTPEQRSATIISAGVDVVRPAADVTHAVSELTNAGHTIPPPTSETPSSCTNGSGSAEHSIAQLVLRSLRLLKTLLILPSRQGGPACLKAWRNWPGSIVDLVIQLMVYNNHLGVRQQAGAGWLYICQHCHSVGRHLLPSLLRQLPSLLDQHPRGLLDILALATRLIDMSAGSARKGLSAMSRISREGASPRRQIDDLETNPHVANSCLRALYHRFVRWPAEPDNVALVVPQLQKKNSAEMIDSVAKNSLNKLATKMDIAASLDRANSVLKPIKHAVNAACTVHEVVGGSTGSTEPVVDGELVAMLHFGRALLIRYHEGPIDGPQRSNGQESIPKLLVEEMLHGCLLGRPISSSSDTSLAPTQLPRCRTSKSRQAALGLARAAVGADIPALTNGLDILRQVFYGDPRGSGLPPSTDADHVEWNLQTDDVPWSGSSNSPDGIRSKFIGLKNFGATCFVSSIIQQCFLTPDFQKAILSLPKTGPRTQGGHLLSELNKLFGALSAARSSYLSPTSFLRTLRDGEGGKLSLSQQMDAYEFFNLFMDQVSEALIELHQQHVDQLEQKKKVGWFDVVPSSTHHSVSVLSDPTKSEGGSDPKVERVNTVPSVDSITRDQGVIQIFGPTQEQTLPYQIFGGSFNNEIISLSCPHVSRRQEAFLNILLPVKGRQSVTEALDAFVDGEMLEGENQYFIEEQDKKVDALKRTTIGILPRVLVLVLKRFDFDFDAMAKFKLNDYCEFERTIDMAPYTTEGVDGASAHPKLYHLRGVVVHSGVADCGHYYTFSRTDDVPSLSSHHQGTGSNMGQRNRRPETDASPNLQKWCRFDDTNVTFFDANKLGQETFGGTYSERDPKQHCGPPGARSSGAVKEKAARSAYMLFYEAASDVVPQEQDFLAEERAEPEAPLESNESEVSAPLRPAGVVPDMPLVETLPRYRRSWVREPDVAELIWSVLLNFDAFGLPVALKSMCDGQLAKQKECVFQSTSAESPKVVREPSMYEFETMLADSQFPMLRALQLSSTQDNVDIISTAASSAIVLSVSYTCDILVRSPHAGHWLGSWVDMILRLLRQVGTYAQRWMFLGPLNHTRLYALLLECPVASTRKQMARLIMGCMQLLYPKEHVMLARLAQDQANLRQNDSARQQDSIYQEGGMTVCASRSLSNTLTSGPPHLLVGPEFGESEKTNRKGEFAMKAFDGCESTPSLGVFWGHLVELLVPAGHSHHHDRLGSGFFEVCAAWLSLGPATRLLAVSTGALEHFLSFVLQQHVQDFPAGCVHLVRRMLARHQVPLPASARHRVAGAGSALKDVNTASKNEQSSNNAIEEELSASSTSDALPKAPPGSACGSDPTLAEKKGAAKLNSSVTNELASSSVVTESCQNSVGSHWLKEEIKEGLPERVYEVDLNPVNFDHAMDGSGDVPHAERVAKSPNNIDHAPTMVADLGYFWICLSEMLSTTDAFAPDDYHASHKRLLSTPLKLTDKEQLLLSNEFLLRRLIRLGGQRHAHRACGRLLRMFSHNDLAQSQTIVVHLCERIDESDGTSLRCAMRLGTSLLQTRDEFTALRNGFLLKSILHVAHNNKMWFRPTILVVHYAIKWCMRYPDLPKHLVDLEGKGQRGLAAQNAARTRHKWIEVWLKENCPLEPGAVASIGSISDVASGISRFFKDPLGTASKQTAEQIRCAGMNKPAWNTSLNEKELKDTPTALLGAFSYTEYIPHIQKILTGQQLIADFGYDSDYDPVLQAGCR